MDVFCNGFKRLFELFLIFTILEIPQYIAGKKSKEAAKKVAKIEFYVLINSVMGLCGESGEAIDIVKKWLAQGHELDKEHLIKELRDIAWYLAEAATALDIPLEQVFQSNIDKLKKRYPEGFQVKRSLGRLSGDL